MVVFASSLCACRDREVPSLYQSRSAVTNALHTLERAGLGERRPSTMDGRAVTVELTGRGEEVVREVFEIQAAREQEWFAGLDEAERAGLTAAAAPGGEPAPEY